VTAQGFMLHRGRRTCRASSFKGRLKRLGARMDEAGGERKKQGTKGAVWDENAV